MATSDYSIKDLEKAKFLITEDGVSVRTSTSPAPTGGSGSTSGRALLDLEYQKFIETPDGIAVRFTNVGAWPVLQTWEAGKNYTEGEMVNSGSDGNWLFKVIKDHVSSDVPEDVANGNLLAISPPLIATGVQDGGEVSLIGQDATVQAGTGFIAIYGTTASAYPLISIVEWPTQSIHLDPTGIHSLFIAPNKILRSSPGFITSEEAALNVGVALVDMNLGLAYDTKTYPTNPVGQLRSLSFFFGGMTKGLKYFATGLQLSRSSYEVYAWGTDNTDPYDPNTKIFAPKNPVTFFEFTQTGAVAPVTQTTIKTGVYDLNGALVPMGNNKWGFVRIYTSLGEDDFIMYSQAEYQTETDAKTAATSPNFIKPPDLNLTKFSAWFVFEKGDLDLSNNNILVCEPFGCDSFGSTGGGGGAGDVVGPGISVAGNLAMFADTSGKVLADSGQPTALMLNTLINKIPELEKRIEAIENKKWTVV